MSFTPGFKPATDEKDKDLYFVFQRGRLLVKRENGRIAIPDNRDLEANGVTIEHQHYFGDLDGSPCYTGDVPANPPLLDHFELKDLRALLTKLDEELIWIAGQANQLANWNRNHQYCGVCGRPTMEKPDERAKICPSCNLTNYPRLSPAVIVAVTRGDEILLARNQRFKIPIYSVLAGFVEPGETLEDCIHREIKEEVGISVENIRYFGSQPWPFPDSLMIAFTAEYRSGDIEVDLSEIVDAKWFTKENLPQVPTRISIAGRLIEWFRKR